MLTCPHCHEPFHDEWEVPAVYKGLHIEPAGVRHAGGLRKLAPQPQYMLELLIRLNGRLATQQLIESYFYARQPCRGYITPTHARVLIQELREALAGSPLEIVNVYARGWYLAAIEV